MYTMNRFKSWILLAVFPVFLFGGSADHRQMVISRTLHEPMLKKLKNNRQASNCQEQHRRTITIFIHGTAGRAQILPIQTAQHHFKCKQGLALWTVTGPEFQLHQKASLLIESDPSRFNPEDFYLFGWSGKLSFQAREDAARELYHALVVLLEQLRDRDGQLPVVRIITHSHGGNVALLLAEIAAIRQQELIIDELILLACPVQDRTEHLIKNSMFKKIYAIYSTGDFIQIGDPQGAYRGSQAKTFFSRRRFPARQSLHQVTIKFNGHSLGHIDFSHAPFLPLLPGILNEIDSYHAQIQASLSVPHEIRLAINIKR